MQKVSVYYFGFINFNIPLRSIHLFLFIPKDTTCFVLIEVNNFFLLNKNSSVRK